MKWFIVVLLLLTACQGQMVCFENNCFSVEIVDTPESRQRGLMYREHLDQDKGMLFIFDTSNVYSFWMRNTLIPLDIIWIDENYEVVFIGTMHPCEEDPCYSLNPGVPALYVLELNAGTAEEIGLEVGDSLRFRNI